MRVAGRWLRRKPLGIGQPQLVLERDENRHRFPATPEPPGLSGVAPGRWQMSFTVPAALTPADGDRLWLGLGTGTIPIPLPEDSVLAERERPAGGEALLLERRMRGSELALTAAQRRAQEAEAELVALRAQLAEVVRELGLARAGSVQRDRARRVAEQRAHAETQRREELQEELSRVADRASLRAAQQDELLAARVRIQELEADQERFQRAVAEADRAAQAADGVRRRAEAAQRAGARRTQTATLALEAELANRASESSAPGPIGIGGAPAAGAAAMLRVERRMTGAWRPLNASRSPGRQSGAGGRLARLVTELRGELDLLRAGLAKPHAQRTAAQELADQATQRLREERERGRIAWDAIEQLRAELGVMREAAPDPAVAPMAPAPPTPRSAEPRPLSELDPVRLDAARTRLRAAEPATPARDSSAFAAPAGGPAWLQRAFAALTRDDALTAGRLALALLPSQRLVLDGPLRYDLDLTGIGTVRVAVPADGDPVSIELSPRPSDEEAQFVLAGDLPALARRLASASSRRTLGRDRARIRGDRRAARKVLDWLGEPVTLSALRQAGVTFEPWLALSLVAHMIDPGWTRGESFDLAFADPVQSLAPTVLHVRDGARLRVTQLLTIPADATAVLGEPGGVLGVLSQDWPPGTQLRGEAGPLDRVLAWTERAQSG